MNKKIEEKTEVNQSKLQLLLCVLIGDALIVIPVFILLLSVMSLVGVCGISFDIPLTMVGTFSFVAGVLIMSLYAYKWGTKSQ